MKKISGIIFDIDGTLAQTNQLIFETFRYVTRKYLNLEYSDSDIVAMFGPTEEEILLKLMNDKYEVALYDYYDFYELNHEKFVKPYKGINELVSFLHSKGLPLSIYTGKGKVSARITLEKLDLVKYFSLIVSGSDVKSHKPSREGVDMFINKFSISRKETLLIGDSTTDIIAARNGNIYGASVLWDPAIDGWKEKVLRLGNDFIFNTVEELSRFFHSKLT